MTAAYDDPQRPTSLFAAVLSYLIPGLGQIYQGRFGKGFLFLFSLLGLFFLGQLMGGWKNVYMPPVAAGPDNFIDKAIRRPAASIYTRWHFAGQFWVGMAAWPAIWQFYGMPMPEQSPFLANFQRAPADDEVNEFLANSDKTPDLGWVYTVIAGMLNVLVIYDAYAGPAHGSHRPARKDEAGEPVPEGAAS